MPKRFRMTRRFNAALTEDAYRGLRRFADEAGLDENEALSFVFEHFGSIMNHEALPHRLRLFKAELADRNV